MTTLVPTLRFTDEDQVLRTRLRLWLQEHEVGEPPREHHARNTALIAWQRTLHEAGFIGLSLPREYGGAGRTLSAEAVFAEELAASRMPELINRVGLFTVAPLLMDFGTPEQRRRFISPILGGDELWCQGFSEPGAGSDLAAVSTRGRREAESLVITGQKVWTSRADISRWCAALIRSEPGSTRHQGLTFVIIDMHSPGVLVRPMYTMARDEHFSEVFLDEVQVQAQNIVGSPGDGWRIAMAMLSYERGLFTLERQIRLQHRLDDLVERLQLCGVNDWYHDIGRVQALLELLRAQVYRTLAAQQSGRTQPGSTSIDKLLLARVYQELFSVAHELLGPNAALEDTEWTHDLLVSRSVSIYSGTSEIQRNVIASQLLGIRGAMR